MYGMITGAFVGCIYGQWYLRNSFRFRFNWACLKEMLLFSAPLVPSGIAVFLSFYVDRMMINYYLSLDAVGLYGIGFRLASIVGLVMVGFQGALTPLVYSYYRREQTPQDIASIFRFFIAFSLVVFLAIGLFSQEILWLMTTPAYYTAASLVIYLVPAILLSNMYIFTPGIGIAKKTHLILWINLGGAILNIVLNWLLIPSFGTTGAAIAKLLGYACIFAAYMFFSQRLYHVPHNWVPLSLSVVSIAGLAALGSRINLGLSLDIAIKTSLICSTGFLFMVTGLLRWSEMEKAFIFFKRQIQRAA
jgi:O-antigen/teichoic acid export membrane protein